MTKKDPTFAEALVFAMMGGKQKPQRSRAVAVRKEIVPAKRLKITDEMLGRAMGMFGGARHSMISASAMFKPADHPPGVVPERFKSHYAMDEFSTNAGEWAAQQYYNYAAVDGAAFLGYPMLAILAQRSEYRMIVETIAEDATRNWIKLTSVGGDKGKSDKIKIINDEMDRLDMKGHFRKMSEHDGYFGRSHLYLDTGNTDDRQELKTPIGNGRNKITQLKVNMERPLLRLASVEPVWCYPSSYNSNDPLKPEWYNPSQWFVQGKEVHVSRLLWFVAREVPDLLKPAYSFGGLSMTQMAMPYVQNWIETRQAVNRMI